jgi:cellulose synthase/poly-beta-1,6-N-acetylglucosamine synthase-like glycosyltransferase
VRWIAANTGTAHEQTVVGVIDADGRLAGDALDMLAGPDNFGDDRVGAVQVQVRMINRGRPEPDGDDAAAPTRFGRALVLMQDLEFRTVIAGMQHLRHGMGSAGMGGNGQFTRLSTLDAIAAVYGTPWHGALLEDFELGLHALFVGARNTYCDDTWVAQEGLPAIRPLLRQRVRWAQGGMQCFRYMRQVLGSRRLTTPAALEICYFLIIPWTQLLGTVVYTLSALALVSYAFGDPGGVSHWFASGGWGLFPLVAVFGIFPMAVWGIVYRLRCDPSLGRLRALALGLGYWLFSYLMIAAVWRGFARLVRARNGWAKTDRLPQASRTGPAPGLVDVPRR